MTRPEGFGSWPVPPKGYLIAQQPQFRRCYEALPLELDRLQSVKRTPLQERATLKKPGVVLLGRKPGLAAVCARVPGAIVDFSDPAFSGKKSRAG